MYSVIKFSSDIASVLVGFTSDMDDDAKRDAVKSAIAEFQEFEYGPHTLENTMPWQQQDSEANDRSAGGILTRSRLNQPQASRCTHPRRQIAEPDSSA